MVAAILDFGGYKSEIRKNLDSSCISHPNKPSLRHFELICALMHAVFEIFIRIRRPSWILGAIYGRYETKETTDEFLIPKKPLKQHFELMCASNHTVCDIFIRIWRPFWILASQKFSPHF